MSVSVECPVCSGRGRLPGAPMECTFCTGTGSYPVSSQAPDPGLSRVVIDLGPLPGMAAGQDASLLASSASEVDTTTRGLSRSEAVAFRAGYQRGIDVSTRRHRIATRVAITKTVLVASLSTLAAAPYIYGWLA